MRTILVNRLEDNACPVNVWLGKLTALDMTPLGWLGRKTNTNKPLHDSGRVLSFHFIHIKFPDNNFKRQWIFTKLGMCIDIVKIWFWIANGQIRQILTGVCPRHTHIFIFGR